MNNQFLAMINHVDVETLYKFHIFFGECYICGGGKVVDVIIEEVEDI